MVQKGFKNRSTVA